MGAVRCKRRPIIVNNKEHAESIFGWSYDSLLRPERRRPVAIPSEVKGEKREFFPVVRPHIVVDVVQRWNCLSFHLSSALRYTTTQFRFWLWCTTSESGGQGRKKERKKDVVVSVLVGRRLEIGTADDHGSHSIVQNQGLFCPLKSSELTTEFWWLFNHSTYSTFPIGWEIKNKMRQHGNERVGKLVETFLVNQRNRRIQVFKKLQLGVRGRLSKLLSSYFDEKEPWKLKIS